MLLPTGRPLQPRSAISLPPTAPPRDGGAPGLEPAAPPRRRPSRARSLTPRLTCGGPRARLPPAGGHAAGLPTVEGWHARNAARRAAGADLLPARRIGPGGALPRPLARPGRWRLEGARGGRLVGGAWRARKRARLFRWPGGDPGALRPRAPCPRPMRASPPLHGSYEDRPGAPDRFLAALDGPTYEHHVAEWERVLATSGALGGVEVAHLHHLTPAHEAIARLAPALPVICHLHGTELLMLAALAARPEAWPHAQAWVERMRRWAHRATLVLASSPASAAGARRLLGLDPTRMVVVPNGVDPEVFDGRRAAPTERGGRWRRWLVDEPRSWTPADQRPGSVRYQEPQIAPLLDPEACVVLFVGRFTAVKRAPLLIRAHARARARLGRPLPLVVWGGAPGEWRASTRPRPRPARRPGRGLPGRLAGTRRPARGARRRRRARRPIGGRALRPGLRRGDGHERAARGLRRRGAAVVHRCRPILATALWLAGVAGRRGGSRRRDPRRRPRPCRAPSARRQRAHPGARALHLVTHRGAHRRALRPGRPTSLNGDRPGQRRPAR